MLNVRELCQQVATLSGASSLKDEHVGHMLAQWFQSSSLAQRELKGVLDDVCFHIHNETCKATVADYAKTSFAAQPLLASSLMCGPLVRDYGVAHSVVLTSLMCLGPVRRLPEGVGRLS